MKPLNEVKNEIMKLTALITSVIALTASSQAALLTNYTFLGNVNTSSDTAAGTASDFELGSGSLLNTRARYRGDVTSSTAATSTVFDATFDFTVAAGTEATFTSLSLEYTNNNGNPAAGYGFGLFASNDGVNYTLIQDNATGGLNEVSTTYDMDLSTFTSGLAYAAGETIYFGLSIYDPGSNTGINNLSLIHI